MKKSIMTPLTVAEFREKAGTKITKIGKKRLFVVRNVLAGAMKRHATVNDTAVTLKRIAASKNDKKRDWVSVVQTEYTEAKAAASIDLLRDLFGDDHSVYREPDPDCCDKCQEAFGSAPKFKKFRLGDIPDELKGAVHPRCCCGPWRSVETPDLTKAMDPLADVPVGVVKRVPDGVGYKAEVSTGTGYWVPLDSDTGRSIMRLILMHTPAILAGSAKGFSIFEHGRHVTKKPYKMYDILKLGAARFYPYDLSKLDDNTIREKGMTLLCDLQQYLEKVRAALPTVACMPEYWDDGQKWRYLTDFLGYKTLTDWTIILPGEPPLDALIARVSPRQMSQRRAIRSYVQWALRGETLKKAQKTFTYKDALEMMEGGRVESFSKKKKNYIIKLLKKIAPDGWKLTTVSTAEINRRDPDEWKVYPDKIKEYTKMDPNTMPPVLLTSRGYDKENYGGGLLEGSSKENYTVIDGNHRHEAALKLGMKKMKAWVPR